MFKKFLHISSCYFNSNCETNLSRIMLKMVRWYISGIGCRLWTGKRNTFEDDFTIYRGRDTSHHKFESIHFYWTRPLMQQGLHIYGTCNLPTILHQYEENSFFREFCQNIVHRKNQLDSGHSPVGCLNCA